MSGDERMEWLDDGVREKREEKSGQRLLEIPMFSLEEAHSIASLFDEHAIRHERDVLHRGADLHRGYHAYTFWVREDQFMAAIEVLKEWFHIPPEGADYDGVCPACGAQVVSSPACPECDLNLSGDYSEARHSHAFVQFLKRHKLLGGRSAESPDRTDATESLLPHSPLARRIFIAGGACLVLSLFAYPLLEPPTRGFLAFLLVIGVGALFASLPRAFPRRARGPERDEAGSLR
ncbi:MAG: hypothetical protein ACYTG3_18420 [Planctomycetota bacterium]|jgi:hypothetical protein